MNQDSGWRKRQIALDVKAENARELGLDYEPSMNNETQRIMEALMLIYGNDLQAATITVLLKDGDTAVRFITLTIPHGEDR